MLVAIAPASAALSAPATPLRLKAWQAKIVKEPRPSKGCFTASYPATAWQELTCTRGPSYPAVPKRRPRPPATIGNGNDVSVQAPFGLISKAIGSFDAVSVTSESSPIANVGPPVADAYTLQINTNFFSTPACAGSPNPGCQGWEQFIFGNDGTSGRLHIQYWLLQYNAACPAGWNQIGLGGGSDIYCWKDNSSGDTPVPNQPITSLDDLRLTGEVTATSDQATLEVAGTPYTVVGDNAVSASGGWTISEFNVFGYYGNADGGSMASFNAGAELTVRNRIDYGGTMAPICVPVGFTGETNNLLFPGSAPAPSPPGPAMIFFEDTVGGGMNCDAAITVGDTHETTVAGLKYDFQASGDFVEAQEGTAFEVQTRKGNGAPTWPNTSLNKAVATRMGTTKVAICGEQRVVVDGKSTYVPPGTALSLPSGVDITRVGNTFYVVDQAGHTVRVKLHALYMDVAVGVGAWPTRVRGLLGNPDNDPRRLEARNGTQYTVPLSFSDLYNNFGDSWRVSPLTTMLAPCNTVAFGNPTRPFYAGDLNTEIRQRAQGVCLNAKVTQAWLNACILDVAVLGDAAAAVYAGMEPPVLDGDGGR